MLESAFRYTTDIKLLELSRMDHPLLKELAMRAPGTYHHSIVIGTLAEAGAESINANPLLARVAAYYHDIGKLKMPAYFIENAGDENKHDRLTPSMSSLVITSHVKEGAELAEKHRLGPGIIDIIRQHHGTSLISFFYQKAVSGKDPDGKEVDEKSFRYPGPKPQTKEAGLVMLADAIEAASKTLPDPTPDRVQWLSQKIVNRIFTDGQLDECELTLKDLHSITKSFNRVFAGIYHQRIDYPEPAQLLTEVLSFPMDDASMLGDVVISIEKAALQAARFGVTLEEETGRLVAHGLLHLLGYDHVRGGRQAAKMKRAEEELMGLFRREGLF